MTIECTGIILAGGKNSRLPGKKKTFRRVGEQSIIEKMHKVFSEVFSEVILVVNEPESFAAQDMILVTDINPARCALAGLHTGLFYATHPYAFVAACDIPFLSPEIIRYVLSEIRPGYDVIIPKTDDGLEPLSAVYSKRCLPRIEAGLEKREYMIKKFYNRRKVRELPVQNLRKIDPELDFSFNVNTPEDLALARQMAVGKINKKE